MSVTSQFTGPVKPLQSISPTTFTAAKQCVLKLIWSSCDYPALLPVFPGMHIGRVVHKLLLEAGQGRFPPDKEIINARWNEMVEDIHSELRASPLERHLVPLANLVRDVAVRRIQAIQRAYEIASAWQPRQQQGRALETMPRYGREISVQTLDGLIKGRIDAVFPRHDGIVIRDYKSGKVTESAGEGDRQLNENYQTQLKMYAALYAESFGKWPDTLEVMQLSGLAKKVSFEKTDCLNLLVEAKATLQELNCKIMSNSQKALPGLLANPSPRVCTYCQYRPACEVYQSTIPGPGSDHWPLDVIGTLVDIRKLRNSKMMLQVTTPTNLVSIPGISPGDRHPTLQDLQQGDEIGVFNLRRVHPTAPYSETPLTRVYKLCP